MDVAVEIYKTKLIDLTLNSWTHILNYQSFHIIHPFPLHKMNIQYFIFPSISQNPTLTLVILCPYLILHWENWRVQEKILLYLPHQIYHLTCICNHTIIVSFSTVKSINITCSHVKPTFPHLLWIPSTSALNTPLAFSIFFLLQLSLWCFISSVSFSHLYW